MKAQLIVVNGYDVEHTITNLNNERDTSLPSYPEEIIERLIEYTEPERKFYNGYFIRLILSAKDRKNAVIYNKAKDYMKAWENRPVITERKFLGIQFQVESTAV